MDQVKMAPQKAKRQTLYQATNKGRPVPLPATGSYQIWLRRAGLQCRHQFLGQWYAVAVASDCPQFLQMKSMMKMPITIFSLLDDGDLYAATGVPGPSGCMKMDMVYHTVKPGRYTQSVPEKSDIRFVEGDSDVSLLEYSQSVSESGDACKMVRLFARKPEIPAEAVPHFKMLIAAVGLAIGDATQLPRDSKHNACRLFHYGHCMIQRKMPYNQERWLFEGQHNPSFF
ncbi:hypothetical protein NDU88_011906 [Pleurodeles waltl]|uniref:Lipocalin/cytosolic fatty-acid binding domain-containing protein n=1 Tax=Pleurodeles waltl TaxID=8319 RepID=A0AAV7R058_PLEWA|nr:hypothetical protein NDU88_011906 [Pleurodeles waltl]